MNKGHINVVVRLANTNHNWSSTLDKDIARKIPELKDADEYTVDPQLGSNSRVVVKVSNPLLIGGKRIDCFNCYCLEKDEAGKFILNKDFLKSFLKELEKSHREHIFALLVKNEGAVSKTLVYKILEETVQFNKAWILS